LALQGGAWALTGELSCGITITSAKLSIATAAGTANTRLSQAGAAAEAEPGAVVRRDEPSGGGRKLGIRAFDDLGMVDTSHVEVGVEHLSWVTRSAGRSLRPAAFRISFGEGAS
jgi:hypothetical protein